MECYDFKQVNFNNENNKNSDKYKLSFDMVYDQLKLMSRVPEIKKELTLIIKNKNENPKAVKRAVEIVISCGGIEYGYKRMKEFADKALELIAEFPTNEAKASLELLVNYTMNREK